MVEEVHVSKALELERQLDDSAQRHGGTRVRAAAPPVTEGFRFRGLELVGTLLGCVKEHNFSYHTMGMS